METQKTNYPILITVLLFLGGLSLSNLWTNWISSDWMPTEGVLLQCKLGNGKYATDLMLSYRFTVNNQVFYGDRADLSVMGKGDIPESLKGLKAGDKVVVYYDPTNPKKNSLSLDSDLWISFLLLIMSFGGAAALFYKIYLRSEIKNERS